MVSILNVSLSPTSYSKSTSLIGKWVDKSESRYVCAANVHMLMEAHDSHGYREIVNSADLVTPDGMPLVWMMRLKGEKKQGRVYGPDLMLAVLELAQKNGFPVGFYGSSSMVLDVLKQRLLLKYPDLKMNYSFSPPFREMSEEEDRQVVDDINNSGIRILFVGLGCPKQEIWMAEHKGKIPVVMIGVGAAFDFHAGVKSQAPVFVQRAGFEWLFRLVNEPGRLWRRYLYHNSRFVFLALADLLGFFRTI
jgi:N-acetylglucosaminyldiphosphoundecaprenol N-acetyl-beta-D-mannosaminyltransferase